MLCCGMGADRLLASRRLLGGDSVKAPRSERESTGHGWSLSFSSWSGSRALAPVGCREGALAAANSPSRVLFHGSGGVLEPSAVVAYGSETAAASTCSHERTRYFSARR